MIEFDSSMKLFLVENGSVKKKSVPQWKQTFLIFCSVGGFGYGQTPNAR